MTRRRDGGGDPGGDRRDAPGNRRAGDDRRDAPGNPRTGDGRRDDGGAAGDRRDGRRGDGYRTDGGRSDEERSRSGEDGGSTDTGTDAGAADEAVGADADGLDDPGAGDPGPTDADEVDVSGGLRDLTPDGPDGEGEAADDADGGEDGRSGPGRLTALRADRRRRLAATTLGATVGLLVSTVHWGGFVLGGALVALPQRSLPRGLLAGAGLGVLVVVAFGARLALAGALPTALGMSPVVGIAAAAPVAGGLLGSLARGVI